MATADHKNGMGLFPTAMEWVHKILSPPEVLLLDLEFWTTDTQCGDAWGHIYGVTQV